MLAAGLPAGLAACSPRPWSTTRTCCPGVGTSVSTLPFCASADELVAACDEALRSREPASRAGRGHRRLERHRRGVAARRARRRSLIGTGRACSSTPRSSPRIGRSTWPPPASTSWRCPATSSTRPSEQEHSSATQACSRSCRCFRAEERSAGSRSTTSSGPTRRSATRRARRTCSAQSRWRRRADACRSSEWSRIAEAERALFARLLDGLGNVPGLETLTLWPEGSVDRVGVVAFNLAPYRDPLLAAVLSAEHAIGVRNGCFCAQPLIVRLLGIPGERRRANRPRAACRSCARRSREPCGRASASAARAPTSTVLVSALTEVAAFGPRARYEHEPDRDEYRPAGSPSSCRTCAPCRAAPRQPDHR